MILEALKRKHVEDDRLWEMVNRANQLTNGSLKCCDDNAVVLVPLMEKILVRSREKEDWRLYFYAMAKLFWLLRRKSIYNIRRCFQLSEIFHRDNLPGVRENSGVFEGEWRVDMAGMLLDFYMDYPQINGSKLEQMEEIFFSLEQRYGTDWNRSDYHAVMRLAMQKRDKKLAETARKKIAGGDFKLWCYICYYIQPMLEYYVLFEDFEGIEDSIVSVAQKTIPVKYQWCFSQCERTDEEVLVCHATITCLKYGSNELFKKLFARWKFYFEEAPDAEIDTHEVILRALAGNYSLQEDYLRIAEGDDQDAREKREAPVDSMYWALCWYVYFQMLDKNGVKSVRMKLGNESQPGNENRSEWTCLDAAAYFERQADAIGAQMDGGRKWFNYGEVKKRYEECFLEE